MRQRTEYLNLRILPAVKEGLRTLAAREYRSIAGMIEVMVRDRCREAKIPIAERETKPEKQPVGAGEEKRKKKSGGGTVPGK